MSTHWAGAHSTAAPLDVHTRCAQVLSRCTTRCVTCCAGVSLLCSPQVCCLNRLAGALPHRVQDGHHQWCRALSCVFVPYQLACRTVRALLRITGSHSQACNDQQIHSRVDLHGSTCILLPTQHAIFFFSSSSSSFFFSFFFFLTLNQSTEPRSLDPGSVSLYSTSPLIRADNPKV